MWSVLLGGVTGLAGTIWGGYNQRKLKELDMEDKRAGRSHEIAMVRAESEAMKAEAEASIRVTEAQVQGAVTLEEARAYTVTQKSAAKPAFLSEFMDRLFATTGWVSFLAQPVGTLLCLFFGLVDTVKQVARPGITAYLLGISTWITIQAWDVLEAKGEAITAVMATGIVSDVVGTVLYLTSSAVTWWFGDRMAAKGVAKLLEKRG